MPTLTNTQGVLTGFSTPSDTITIAVNSGAYSLEYPIGTALATGSTTSATYALGAGQWRLSTTGSVTWTYNSLDDGPQPITTLYASAVASTITDTAGQSTTESTLVAVTIPANTMGINNRLEFEPLWTSTNSAATKRTRIRCGGTVCTNLDLTTHLVFPQKFWLQNTGSLSSQTASPNSTTIYGPIGSVGAQSFTIDFSVDQVFTITGQFPVAGTGTNTLGVGALRVTKI